MPDLCELDDVKEWLSLGNDKADKQLGRLITATSADFLREIDRGDLSPNKTYTDVLEILPHNLSRPLQDSSYLNSAAGNGSVKVGLNHWPINSITTVELDGVALTESSDGIEDGWFFNEDEEPEYRNTLQIIGNVGSFRRTRSTLKVEYDAGYDDVPADIVQAVIEWVAYRYTSKQWIGQSSKHLAQGETVSYQNVDAPPSVKRVIENYSRSSEVLL